MKLLVVLPLIVVAVAAKPKDNAIPFREARGLSSRIVSGKVATTGQFPWDVFMIIEKQVAAHYYCAGALISSRWVLTAAQCAYETRMFNVTLGSLYSSEQTAEKNVIRIATNRSVIHPGYNTESQINDIALIDLKTVVTFSATIKKIPLATEYTGEGVSLTVSGWGKTSDNSLTISFILNYVSVNSTSNAFCKGVYGATNIIDGSLCTVGSPEHGPCYGDLGGPLIKYDANQQATLVGVVSYIHSSGCSSGKPSVYSRTQYYSKWITSVTGPL